MWACLAAAVPPPQSLPAAPWPVFYDPACNAPAYEWNENATSLGPGRCSSNCQCTSVRNCSLAGFCEGDVVLPPDLAGLVEPSASAASWHAALLSGGSGTVAVRVLVATCLIGTLLALVLFEYGYFRREQLSIWYHRLKPLPPVLQPGSSFDRFEKNADVHGSSSLSQAHGQAGLPSPDLAGQLNFIHPEAGPIDFMRKNASKASPRWQGGLQSSRQSLAITGISGMSDSTATMSPARQSPSTLSSTVNQEQIPVCVLTEAGRDALHRSPTGPFSLSRGSDMSSFTLDGRVMPYVEPVERVVCVFIQVVHLGPHREEYARLWIVPVPEPSESGYGSKGDPRTPLSRHGVSVLLPSDPIADDVDLDLDLEKDLIFPLYSFLGAGAFGQVHRAILKGRLPVAVKMVPCPANAPPRMADSLLEEIKIMSRISHPNCVKCYGGCQKPPNIFIVEELMDCSLLDMLHPKGVRGPVQLPLKRVLEIGADVAAALWYLHPSILHRDLKPGNCLLGASGIAKVCDFGIARVKLSTYVTTRNAEAGTIAYMAPECFSQEYGVGEKSDIYSLGIILWEMVTGLRPWAEYSFLMAVVYQVVSCDRRPEFPKQCSCPEPLRKLIRACWRRNPRERPSAGDVLQKLSLMLRQLELQGHL